MDRNGIFAVLLSLSLFLSVVDVSGASLLTKLRFFIAIGPDNISNVPHISPSASPVPVVQIDAKKKPNETSSEGNQPKVADSKGLSLSNNTNSNNSNNTNGGNVTDTTRTVGPPGSKQTGKEKDGKKSKIRESPPKVSENCTEVSRRCTDRGSLVACILNFDSGSKELDVLIQNVGQGTLKVNLKAPNPVDDAWMEVSEHKSIKINLGIGYRSEVKLDAQNGDCVLHLAPPMSVGNFVFHLPSYDQLITPINGAYFLILAVVLFGATWACCLFRKRRQPGEIPYQELEMSAPESGSANNVETADGWDRDWDDDWDEENAVRSPALRHGISVNGLTSRSSNKDG